MRTIIHLSDLHFGRVDQKRIEPLLAAIKNINPDIVVISGDFTQRAKKKQFEEAANFLAQINKPLFLVPGNHDIPLYNIFQRFFSPFRKYAEFISPHLNPVYRDNETAIIGINSVRRFKVTSGRISEKQVEETEEFFKNVPDETIRIIVCHHPFDLPVPKEPHQHLHRVVGRSEKVMKKLAEQKVDVFLSGHLHLQHIGDTTIRYKIKGYSALIIQTGTAISSRHRGEPVSFNVLRIDPPNIEIDTYVGDEKEANFNLASTEKFKKTEEGWKKTT